MQTSQTISDIAQLYGVQLKYLCKRNKLKPESELQTGEFIYLQTNKPKNNLPHAVRFREKFRIFEALGQTVLLQRNII